jgi:plastocyanin
MLTRGLLWGLLTLSLVAGCSRGDEAPRRTLPPGAKTVDPARAATLSGRVRIEGSLPENAMITMTGDAVCMREQKNGARAETFVSEGGGLGNVFVHVKEGLGNYAFETPSAPVTLDQRGCVYVPHVLGAQVGQNIEFVNSDPTLHTVHALASENAEFNFSQPIKGQKDRRYFTKPEVMIRFRCKVHPWMTAYLGVLDHPYFAVTNPAGAFEVKRLPAGTYTVEAWHETLGRQTQTVTVAESETKEISFTFKAASTAP